ncbi:MAG: hypothetical protein KIT68_12945 [Phycisphaeraceae bacterium]|nr:hypothetical protein [Phycisphaeraceae bacterium]
MTEQIELARLVDLAAARLRLNIEYDAAVLKGTATLRLGAGVNDSELWELTNQLLAVRGFTTVRAPGLETMSVVRISDAAGAARVERGDLPALKAGFSLVLLPVRHRAARDLVDPLKAVMSKTGATVVDVGGRSLLLGDLTPRLEGVLTLATRLDVPSDGVVVHEHRLANMSTAQLVALVTQVASKRDAVASRRLPGEVIAAGGAGSVLVIAPVEYLEEWRGLIESLDRREPVRRESYTARGFSARDVARLIEQAIRHGEPGQADDRFRVTVDDLTDTLMVTATPAQHEQIAGLIARLDAVPPAERRPVRSFVVRNRSVVELASVLQRMLATGVLEAADGGGSPGWSARGAFDPGLPSSPQPSLVTPSPGASPLVQPSSAAGATDSGSGKVEAAGAGRGARIGGSSPVSITADEGTSTIIAIGEARALSQLESLIRTLDVRQPQVMLDVFMVSLTDNETLSLGVELERLRISGSTAVRLSSLFGLSAPLATPSGASRAVPESEGFNGVVLDPGDFSVVVKALETVSQGRSVSSPRLLVTNNQAAVFNSVLQQPFAASFTSGGSTVPTTSFGGTQDAGTQVSVKPQIAEGDHVLLDYSISISSFTGAAASANVPPPKQLNSIRSTAVVPDGYTVVVSGLELTTDKSGASQVPLIGRIPVLGELFKNQTRDGGRTRFYVFIRANVLRGGSFEALRHLSETDGRGAGLAPDWPSNEPLLVK